MYIACGERRRRSDRFFSFLARSIAIAGLIAGAGSCRSGCGGGSASNDDDAGIDAAGAAGMGGSGPGGAGTGGAPTGAGGAGGVGTGGGGASAAGTGGSGAGGAAGAGRGGAGSSGGAGSGGLASGGAGSGGAGGGVVASGGAGSGGAGGRGGGTGGASAALPIKAVYSHNDHTCALSSLGTVRCWGNNSSGQLGYGNTNNDFGVIYTPAMAGDVDVGGKVTQLALGAMHTCALLDNGHVRCWGDSMYGQLGYGNKTRIGDTEKPASAGDVDVGGLVTQLAAGDTHTCAVLDNGHVRCWGLDTTGSLGYGNGNRMVGDDETPASAGDVNVGGTVLQLASGRWHTCALLQGGTVRCWGQNFAGSLGYGNSEHVGDNETPASAGDVAVGGVAIGIAVGAFHSCALLQGGGVRCWGATAKLGYGVPLDSDIIGDDELPSSVVGDVPIGGAVIGLAAGGNHTCALLQGGTVRCWGVGGQGQLGYGNTNNIGDNEPASAAGDVNVGGTVTQLGAGIMHSCAVLSGGTVRCWGSGPLGALGYVMNGNTVGDNETPASVGDVIVY